MVPFVVITTQRTGATFFRTCLESHPEVECPGTIFAQDTKFRFFSVDRPNWCYHKYRTQTFGRRFISWFNTSRSVHGCLDESYRSLTAVAGGYKISYNHIEKYPSIVSWLLEHDVRVIHWTRHNLLRRYVSGLTMRARKVAHSTEPLMHVTVDVSPRRLLKDMRRRAGLTEKYRRLFQDGKYLEMRYESFVSNRELETRKVLAFLGVEYMPLSSPLVKQNTEALEDVIRNYDEVVRTLRGTTFETYLVHA